MSKEKLKAAADQAQKYEWSEPLPFSEISKLEYPVSAFPDLARSAITDFHEYGQMPVPLIGGSVLASMSVAIQSLVNVARDSRLISPVSLDILSVAVSGERKSAADTALSEGIRRAVYELREDMHKENLDRKAKHSAWSSRVEGVKAAIKRTASSGQQVDKDNKPKGKSIDGLEKDLEELLKNEPERQKTIEIFHEDATVEGLAYAIATGWHSHALWSDEGGIVTGGHGMRRETIMAFFGLCNRLWDGKEYRPTRKTVDSPAVIGKRFTANIMLQPCVLHRLVGNGESRDTGFLARFLIAHPESTMGTRLYREPKDSAILDRFSNRIHLFAKKEPDLLNGIAQPKVIRLSSEAKKLWRNYHDATEQQMAPGGELLNVFDFASKSSDNVARIAALFHVFEHGLEGEISETTLSNAIRVAAWYLNETNRVLSKVAEPPHIARAKNLSEWLRGRGEVNAAYILTHGHNSVRTKDKRNLALNLLVELNHCRLVETDGSTTVIVNPAL